MKGGAPLSGAGLLELGETDACGFATCAGADEVDGALTVGVVEGFEPLVPPDGGFDGAGVAVFGWKPVTGVFIEVPSGDILATSQSCCPSV
jgi:hypothetical protein